MTPGRIRRTARRALALAALSWVAVAAASVLMAPSAAAAAAVTVAIRDLTPPVASVDAGGTVTFVNQIQDKTVRVGGGGLLPGLVDVTARTEVTLGLPSGAKPLAPGASIAERFTGSCGSCTITYTYTYSSSAALTQPVVDAARELLPALPARTPFVVNTIVPDLPNPPTVNLPALPPIAAVPPPPEVLPPAPTDPTAAQPTTPPSADPGPGPAPVSGPGDQYRYDTQAGSGLAPSARAAAAAFDPSRFAAAGSGGAVRGASGGSGGSGGAPGGYDGASVPVFGQLAGLSDPSVDEDGVEEASAARSDTPALPAAALAAVVALATVTAALVRTHQAHRASPARPAGR
jgi:hypothetical protein